MGDFLQPREANLAEALGEMQLAVNEQRERAELAEAARQRVLDLCLSRAKPGRKRGVIRGSISVDEVFRALDGTDA